MLRTGGDAIGAEGIDTSNRIDLILEEINQLWSFV